MNPNHSFLGPVMNPLSIQGLHLCILHAFDDFPSVSLSPALEIRQISHPPPTWRHSVVLAQALIIYSFVFRSFFRSREAVHGVRRCPVGLWQAGV